MMNHYGVLGVGPEASEALSRVTLDQFFREAQIKIILADKRFNRDMQRIGVTLVDQAIPVFAVFDKDPVGCRINHGAQQPLRARYFRFGQLAFGDVFIYAAVA